MAKPIVNTTKTVKLNVGDVVKYRHNVKYILEKLPDGTIKKEYLMKTGSHTYIVLCTKPHDHQKPPGKRIKLYTIDTGKIKYFPSGHLTKIENLL